MEQNTQNEEEEEDVIVGRRGLGNQSQSFSTKGCHHIVPKNGCSAPMPFGQTAFGGAPKTAFDSGLFYADVL